MGCHKRRAKAPLSAFGLDACHHSPSNHAALHHLRCASGGTHSWGTVNKHPMHACPLAACVSPCLPLCLPPCVPPSLSAFLLDSLPGGPQAWVTRTFAAHTGSGTTCNGKPVRVSEVRGEGPSA